MIVDVTREVQKTIEYISRNNCFKIERTPCLTHMLDSPDFNYTEDCLQTKKKMRN